MAPDRPLAGRIFSGQLIRGNPGIGRPDKVNLVFGRMIRQRGKRRTPGTFRTQVITTGACPYLYLCLCLRENPGRAVPEGRTGAPHRDHSQPAARPRHRQRADEPRRHGEGRLRRQPAPPGRRMHQPRPRRRDRRPGHAHQPGHLHHLHPRPRHALPRPPRPGRSSRPAARSRCGPPAPPAATCGTSSPPSWEKIHRT
jgi:hypothetical protein